MFLLHVQAYLLRSDIIKVYVWPQFKDVDSLRLDNIWGQFTPILFNSSPGKKKLPTFLLHLLPSDFIPLFLVDDSLSNVKTLS